MVSNRKRRRNINNQWQTLFLIFWFAFGIVSIPYAVETASFDPQPIAHEKFSGSQINFVMKNDVHNITFTVGGSDGFYQQIFLENGTPTLDLSQLKEIKDGVYHYQINAASNEMVKNQSKSDDGRGEKTRKLINKGLQQSGHFRVVKGKIAEYKKIAEPKPKSE